MAKGKMPPQLLEYFKKKVQSGEDKKESDSSKREEALDKAKAKIEEKNSEARAKKQTNSKESVKRT